MPAPSPRPLHYGHLALALTVLLLVGSGAFWAFGLTFGLISGLVVLMAPLYPLLVQALGMAIVVSLCLWRRSYLGALLLGLCCALLPQGLLVAWYGRELWRCQVAVDPAPCFGYLNGSPLLPFFIGLAVLASAGEVMVLLIGLDAARRRAFGPGW